MADKSKRNATMLDMMKQQSNGKNKSITSTQQSLHESTLEIPTISPELINNIKSYNECFYLIGTEDKYSDVRPTSQILIKCSLIEPEISPEGLITPFTQQVSVKTPSGHDGFESIELPFVFSTLAKIVAVPENVTMVKPGDYVQLSDRAIQAVVLGQGYNRKVVVGNAFVRADKFPTTEVPTEITDPNFGYLLVSMGDIRVVYDY